MADEEERASLSKIEYKAITAIRGPLIFIEGVPNVGLGELVRVHLDDEVRTGQVLEIQEQISIVQVLEGTSGISRDSTVSLTGETLKLPVSSEMMGRVLDGRGRPFDGGIPIKSSIEMEITGTPLNPVARAYPHDFIETGISSLDGLLSVVRGQKLPIFSGGGLPHIELAAQIVRQSRVLQDGEEFGVILSTIGITQEEASFFIRDLREAGVMSRTVMFVNLANDPTIERLLSPRLALTTAEYFAYQKQQHILVLLLDMTNYCEALREISMARGEIPGRGGYPGYMYTDLASIYERAGRIVDKKGSITLIPILTMPDYDITHPIPDVTGFITEGQIVLSQDLSLKGIYPPIDILPSLSRLMKDGVGEGRTRADHMDVASDIYAAYSTGRNAMDLALVIGENALAEEERRHLQFAREFESKFIMQEKHLHRDIEETMNLGMELLKMIQKG
ncbi:MAG: V-type ATP synthase subunit B [Candidatus Bathyarchaeota archaeon]|nr:MAG: V-type ATP synthase subunit B [Candidatus Bathyarchaeota archaeon]